MKKDKKLMLSDVLLVVLSLYLAFLIRLDFRIPSEYVEFFKLSIIPAILITLFFNKIFHLYDSIWKYASIEELMSIIYSISLSNVVIIIYNYFINYKLLEAKYVRFPYGVHIIFWLLSVVALGGMRFRYRIMEETIGDKTCNKRKKKLLIIGAGDASALLIKEIKKSNNLNYNIIGLIDDDKSKIGKLISGVKVIGGRENIKAICEEKSVEEIILAIPSADVEIKRAIINICKDTNAKLKTLPGIYEIIDGKVSINKVRDVSIEDLLGREEVKLNSDNINKYIKDKVILVTGGGGSIGSELCRQIAKFNPKKLLILDIYENNAYDLQMELNYNYPNLNKEVIIASIRDEKRLNDIFSKYKPEVVFHAAAHKHVPLMESNPAEAIKNNIVGTYNVVKCSHEFGVKKFVQISTDKAVNPTNIMGATKRFCEIIIQAFDSISNTEYVAVRFGNVLGSNGSVIPLFKKQIAHGGPVTVTHPEINRYFMTIPEAAQLVIQAGAMAKGGEIFVLDMGEPVKIVDLAKDLIRLSGYQPDVEIKIEYTGLRPGEKLYEELLMNEIALTSTEHDKIYVEKPTDNTIEFVEESIDEFKQVIYKEKEDIIKLVEEKVPSYKRKTN
ncbi:FlaA1/EpsC-like NDP-sugar epimerase [Clostridium tetanomorphum]|uniref:Polysaccharide biosynthesis protein n=1 Tax=Clostridium tetanomorphum TaxID=1553 RepID=A0A923EAB7_CLOTT|nr:nucleoside-diphosphate sugar epimerase/dehydratase [Clostridium tetanomorphum]KAJ49418.1 capD protein [Clostridium tetanomorphum DSM 665]KAJ52297.1 capD protein [Clostridium tetanomorphum DSM 665]MBC2399542.1 polysaccharide biosynthesis protein [Clostridium tetanomorphum]MBP1866318.1 FlaA1/EpsC-like NDP-sugar epimerase [Clostridium tetanomorphum]NRS85809.1 FlaA1/EpsC-like NDP-sugar epimerase [Clostridium tetanomorphum]